MVGQCPVSCVILCNLINSPNFVHTDIMTPHHLIPHQTPFLCFNLRHPEINLADYTWSCVRGRIGVVVRWNIGCVRRMRGLGVGVGFDGSTYITVREYLRTSLV